MPKLVAVVLCGCGFKDGSEIHEATLTLLHLSRAGATYQCFAPDLPQAVVTNHAGGPIEHTPRNMLAEAARIARGQIADIATLRATDYDALILPGGFGAAMNLCTFGTDGPQCLVNPDLARAITEFHRAKKPIGAICIAPAIVAKVLGAHHVRLTIGTDADTAAALTTMGAVHELHAVDDICVDDRNRVVSTPAYMLAHTIAETNAGIEKLVRAVLGYLH